MSLDWREVYSSERKELDYSDVRTSLFYMRGYGLLNYCCLAKDCDLRKQAPLPMRLYYNDVGMAGSLMANADSDQAAGVIAENFVYLSLNGRDKMMNDSILHEYPAFGTCEYYEKSSDSFEDADGDRSCDQDGNSQKPEMAVGEIDFLHKSRKAKKTGLLRLKRAESRQRPQNTFWNQAKLTAFYMPVVALMSKEAQAQTAR